MTFSIIVPAFNVGRLIGDCLQSIIWQDFPKNDYEIIIVEDCSTDNTYSIICDLLDKYKKDPSLADLNIQLIRHKQNMHLGGARNTGIRASKCEYIFFVDSDDYFAGTNVLSSFKQFIEKNPVDVIRSCKCKGVEFLSNPSKGIINSSIFSLFTNEEFLLSNFFCNEVWKGCYRTQYLREKKIYFREHVAYEDADWIFKTSLYTKQILLIDLPYYCYRLNPNSITQKHNISFLRDNIISLDSLYGCIAENECTADVQFKFYRRIGRSIEFLAKQSRYYSTKEFVSCIRHIPKRLKNRVVYEKLNRIEFFKYYMVLNFPRTLSYLNRISYYVYNVITR